MEQARTRPNMDFDLHDIKSIRRGRAQMMTNKYLEFLTWTHPALVIGMYIPIFAYLLRYDYLHNGRSIAGMIGIFLAAVLFWTLAEYLLHRYAFHYQPKKGPLKKVVYAFHGVHHHFPMDDTRLIMPPLPSLIVSVVVFSLFYLIMGNAAFSFYPGFVTGYLLYALMHYFIHTIRTPPKPLKQLWRHHHLHHYKYPDYAYGVSNTLWDHVFGTMPPKPGKKN